MERLFCENCGSLCDRIPCPVCGAKRLRLPESGDLCLLTEQSQLFSGMLADVLKQHEVPFLQKGRLGAGLAMSVGPILESYSFFVPYADFPRAEEIFTALFHPDRTEDDGLPDPDEALPEDEDPEALDELEEREGLEELEKLEGEAEDVQTPGDGDAPDGEAPEDENGI